MLTLDQKRRLHAALVQAFTIPELKLTLTLRLDKSLEDLSAGGPRPQVVDEVVGVAQREGWIYELILAGRDARPLLSSFRELADELFVPAVEPAIAALQRVLYAQIPDLDPVQSRLRQEAQEARICAIEMRTTKGLMTGGTGFLVAPDLVLTACHVLQPAIDALHGVDAEVLVEPRNVRFRFDFKRLKAQVLSWGVYYDLAPKWLVASSRESVVDEMPEPKPRDPTVDELDFALVRLEGAPGNAPIGARQAEPGALTRGWIALPPHPQFPIDSPLQILHHGHRPNGYALTLSLDMRAIIGFNERGTRLKHRTNTYEGSSGAPCFSAGWRLIGLHQGTHRGAAAYNQAIPIHLIRNALGVALPEAPALP